MASSNSLSGRSASAADVRTATMLLGHSDDSISFGQMDEVKQEEWIPRVMKYHPEVLELRERIRPLSDQITFARPSLNAGTRERGSSEGGGGGVNDDTSDFGGAALNYATAKTQVKEVLSHETVMQLILHFMEEEGLSTSKKLLEKEGGVKFVEAVTGEKGVLSSLLAVAVTDTKNVFDEEGGGDVDKEEVELYNYSQSAIKDQDLDLSVNIWDEPPDSLENFVVTLSDDGKKKTVQSASFNKLIEWLTSERNVDLDFRKVFLLTYPMFVSSEGFLHKLIERYFVDDRQIPSGAPNDFKKKLAFRVVSCIKSWISTNPSDWNEVLSNTLLDFVDNYLSPDGFNDFAQNLRSSLAKKDEDRSTTDFGNNYLDPKLPKGVSLFSPSLTLKDIPEEEIARQLTLMDKAIYDAIKPHELLSGNWYRKRYASYNVIAMIEHFNDLAAWVATTILRTPTVKERTKVVCRFITICEYASQLNSFNVLTAIVSGLQSHAIQRLKFTWKEVPTQMRQLLTEFTLTSPENGFGRYKETLRTCKPPCIPFLGIHLRELAFIEESIPNTVGVSSKKMINFNKCQLVHQVMEDLLKFQPISYPLHPIHQISSLLSFNPSASSSSSSSSTSSSLPTPSPSGSNLNLTAASSTTSTFEFHLMRDENELIKLSFKVEPPNAVTVP